MKQDEPIDTDEMMKSAYESAYENPISLDAEGGVHTDSMPRIRAFAGNEDSGSGCYTQSREIDIIIFPGREVESVETIETDQLVDDIARAMIQGTRDKIEGNSKDPERAI